MKSNKLIVLSAPSGSGKTTLMRYLLSCEDLPLGFSISATSRALRGHEQEGRDYYFLSKDEFQTQIKNDAFIEYEEVYAGCYYGTLTSEIERLWEQNVSIIFDIDVVGGLNIKKKYPKQTLTIFIKPPSIETLEQRLNARGTDHGTVIATRIQKAQQELDQLSKFDCVIENNDLKTAQKEVYDVVSKFLVS